MEHKGEAVLKYENVAVIYPEAMLEDHVHAYAKQVLAKHTDKSIQTLEITMDGEYVDVKWSTDPVDFQRIRRITGYLVGTLDRFNDAKRSEEHSRVKHTL